MTIGTHAEKSHRTRTVASNLARQARTPGDEFRGLELSGAGRGTPDQVGEPVTQPRKGFLLRRMQQPGREARRVQRGPEAVAGPGEVVARGGGVEAGIDAAEKDRQARRDDVAQLLAAGLLELGRARPDG